VAFYSFMSQMGMAAQASTSLSTQRVRGLGPGDISHGRIPAGITFSFGPNGKADIILKNLGETDRLWRFVSR